MAMQPDHVDVHAEHQLPVALVLRTVHFRHVDTVVVVRATNEHAPAVEVEIPANLFNLADAYRQRLTIHSLARSI